jgi:polar amino acid transport system substrate-binding protein
MFPNAPNRFRRPSGDRFPVVKRVVAMFLSIIFVCAVGWAPAQAAHAANGVPEEQERNIRVATKELEPFVRFTDTGQEGFSVDLWDEIAERNGWQTSWVKTDTVDGLLADVGTKQADVGIAGISVTAEREEAFDFSHPMFDSGLQIMVNIDQRPGFWSQVGNLVDGSLLKLLGGMLLVLVISGHVVWLVHRRDGRAPKSYLAGVSHGIWVSGSTALAADLGSPRRWIGRLVTLSWILIGIIGIALFTAAVTSQLTVDSINTEVKSINDLPGKSVTTVAGTTSDTFLQRLGIDHQSVTTIDEAYDQLRAKKVDAIVFDAPVLIYRANTLGKGHEAVVGAMFNNEAYGQSIGHC